MTDKPKKTSVILEEIIEECIEDGDVTVSEFLGKLGNRAQAMAILVFSLSAVVAGIVPGFSTVTAVPIMLISLQMTLGRQSIWLPRNIRDKRISPRIVRGALSKSIPVLRMVERFLKPRFGLLAHPYVARLIALIITILALVLSLPIPGGNFLPSIGISILALAMLEGDGLFVLIAVGLVVLTGSVMVDLILQAIHITQELVFYVF